MHRLKLAFAIILLTSPIAANAVVIEISGAGAADGFWDLSVIEGAPDDAALQDQVWFGDSALARLFAETCFLCLGQQTLNPIFGPWFNFEDWDIGQSLGWHWFENTNDIAVSTGGAGGIWQWAVAERVGVPEPGTLALLGLGLVGLGARRSKRA